LGEYEQTKEWSDQDECLWDQIDFPMDANQLFPDPKKIAGWNRLSWKKELGVPKERRYVRVAGVASDIDIVPFTNDLETLQRAVLERVFCVKGEDCAFKEPPRPVRGSFLDTMAGVKATLGPLLPSAAPRSHQEFVDSYGGAKRARYQKALAEIREGNSVVSDEAKLRVFVKYEKTDRTSKSSPVPRVISPRDPKYNLRVGRYLKFLEKPLFRAIDKMFGHKTLFKGMNAIESASIMREKWDSYCQPVAVGLDASRFDQHVSYEALLWEHEIYLQCFKQTKHKRRLAALLKHQLINRCYGSTPDGQLRYKVLGTRMSGDMNTSMGNCLLMCCMIKAYLEFVGVDAHLANNGDDCVLIFEKRDLNRVMGPLPVWFTEMGFTMAIEEPVYEFEEIEFCQTKPVYDGENYIMCRNPHNAIVKDSVMLHPWDGPKYFKTWLNAIGEGGMSLTGGLPLFQEVYAAYRRAGRKYGKLNKQLLPYHIRENLKLKRMGVNRVYGTVSPSARASFYWAFGITPDEQLAAERYYSNLVIGGAIIPYRPRSVFSEGF
jgi:hypothetical protein